MHHHKKNFRLKKRGSANSAEHDKVSISLRHIRDNINQRKYAEALSAINSLLSSSQSDEITSKALSFVGDIQMLKGKFVEAGNFYKNAQQYSSSETECWFRSRLGEVASMLSSSDLDNASLQANNVVDTSIKIENDWQAKYNSGISVFGKIGNVQVPIRPIRSSVVASRLGKLFLQEGEVALAKALFQKAIALNSEGACRARIGLSEVALREQDFSTATKCAREALVVGGYGVKTLSAWSLLITANAHQGLPSLSSRDVNNLEQAKPNVRARAIVGIAVAMRSLNDKSWKSFADSWLFKEGLRFPTAAATLRQLAVADSVRTGDPTSPAYLNSANELLLTDGLSPSEWLIGAKQLLRASIYQNKPLDVLSLLQQAVRAYGSTQEPKFSLGLASVYARANLPAQAKVFLKKTCSMNVQDVHWRRATEKLASLESQDAQYSIAAGLYLSIAQSAATPTPLQASNYVRWAKALVQSGDGEKIALAKDNILKLLGGSQDYFALLDVAHFVLGAPELQDLAETFFSRGEILALNAINTESSPITVTNILVKLSRRYADFRRFSSITDSWENLTDQRRTWLWSTNGDFWEYVSWVFRAYRDKGYVERALALAREFLADLSTPPEGIAILGSLLGTQLIRGHYLQEGFSVLQRAANIQPTNKYCAYAYYWMALKAIKGNDMAAAGEYAQKIVLAIGNRPTMSWQIGLALASSCIIAKLVLQDVPRAKGFSEEQLTGCISQIQSDLQILG